MNAADNTIFIHRDFKVKNHYLLLPAEKEWAYKSKQLLQNCEFFLFLQNPGCLPCLNTKKNLLKDQKVSSFKQFNQHDNTGWPLHDYFYSTPTSLYTLPLVPAGPNTVEVATYISPSQSCPNPFTNAPR